MFQEGIAEKYLIWWLAFKLPVIGNVTKKVGSKMSTPPFLMNLNKLFLKKLEFKSESKTAKPFFFAVRLGDIAAW